MLEAWLPTLREIGVREEIQSSSESEFITFSLDGDHFTLVHRDETPGVLALHLVRPVDFRLPWPEALDAANFFNDIAHGVKIGVERVDDEETAGEIYFSVGWIAPGGSADGAVLNTAMSLARKTREDFNEFAAGKWNLVRSPSDA